MLDSGQGLLDLKGVKNGAGAGQNKGKNADNAIGSESGDNRQDFVGRLRSAAGADTARAEEKGEPKAVQGGNARKNGEHAGILALTVNPQASQNSPGPAVKARLQQLLQSIHAGDFSAAKMEEVLEGLKDGQNPGAEIDPAAVLAFWMQSQHMASVPGKSPGAAGGNEAGIDLRSQQTALGDIGKGGIGQKNLRQQLARLRQAADVGAGANGQKAESIEARNLKALTESLANPPSESAAKDGAISRKQLAQMQQVLADTAGKTAAAKTAEKKNSEGGASRENGVNAHLRQFLNALADQLQQKTAAGTEKPAEMALKDIQAQAQKIEDAAQALKQMGAGHTEGRAASGKEAPSPMTEPVVSTQHWADAGAKAGNLPSASGPFSPAGQADGFGKSAQSAENQIVSQVFVRLFSGAGKGSGSMTIHMHPPELGKVRVRVVSDQGKLNVHLHPQNQQVMGVLEKHLPTLQQSLADQGVVLSDLDVSVDNSGEQDMSQFEEQGFSSARRDFSAFEEDGENEDTKQLSPDPVQSDGSAQGLSLRV
ncbi:MAG: flagellar hook-length control protein FliK [Thermodesulfobacteriota bacterium]